ncbi:MAG: pantoate--beta-alanine ligase, partial [Mesorhizobium sp.]
MSTAIVVDSVAALRAQVREWRRAGLRVAMVPTMGALHDGHI